MTEPIVPDKQCKGCGLYFPATSEYFYLSQKGKYGVNARCKFCERERNKRFRADNPDIIRDVNRRYYEANANKIRTDVDRRRRANPDKQRLKNHQRFARIRNLPDTLTVTQKRLCFEYWNNQCCICGREIEPGYIIAIEHWIAISDPRVDNPGNVATNVLPMCHSVKGCAGEPGCNQSKKNKDPIKWLYNRYASNVADEKLTKVNQYFSWMKSR